MSTVKANNITNVAGNIPTVKGQKLIPTAWCNFDGTGTVAIRDSEGISSVSDSGVGHYTINFTANMASTNYVANISNNYAAAFGYVSTFETVAVGSFQTRLFKATVGNADTSIIAVSVKGGQA